MIRCSLLRPFTDQTSARSSRRLIWTSRWFRWTSTTSSRPLAAAWSKVIGRISLRVRDAPGPRRTPPSFLQGGQREDRLAGRVAGPGSAAGCSASSRPTSTTLWMFSGESRSSRWVSWYCSSSRLDLLRQVPLELEHLAHGLDLGLGPLDAGHRVAPPSIACSTSSAITVPTCPGLPGSSRPSGRPASGTPGRRPGRAARPANADCCRSL